MKYYLAYGSNLNVRQMAYRCPDAKVVGTTTIKGYELLFKGSKTGAYLTIEPKEGGEVPVAVWEVSEADERNLDRYEGYPDFYYKKEMPIKLTNGRRGRTIVAFVYIMHEYRALGVPSDHYLKTCFEGYEEFRFDDKYIVDAYEKSVRRSAI